MFMYGWIDDNYSPKYVYINIHIHVCICVPDFQEYTALKISIYFVAICPIIKPVLAHNSL